MSVARIRTLLNDKLLTELFDGVKLKYPTFINGIQAQGITGTYLQADLIPSPVINGTIGGDHRGYIGLYQIRINVMDGMENGQPISDPTHIIDQAFEDIQSIFPINARIGDENEFVVQVQSSLTVTQTTRDDKDYKWYAHVYFTYRADTN